MSSHLSGREARQDSQIDTGHFMPAIPREDGFRRPNDRIQLAVIGATEKRVVDWDPEALRVS